MATPVYIAVEDDLSEAVLRRLLDSTRRLFSVQARYPLRTPAQKAARRAEGITDLSGYGFLKRNLAAFNLAAARCAHIVLTDMDVHARCPGEVLPLWLPEQPHRNLIFRVAVREVETWLLADARNFAHYLGISWSDIPANVEQIMDPKETIVDLARRSTHPEIVADLVPAAGSSSAVGRYFSRSLLNFARNRWDLDDASRGSRSLAKAIRALRRFKPLH